MKKLIALILVAASLLCFASCGEEESADGVAAFVSMYEVSAPTKVLTNYVISIGGVEFTGSTSLVTGVTTTGKRATVQLYEYETIQSIENGSGEVVLPIMGEPISGSREYFEGKGERYNGGGWDAGGHDFAPVAGSIAIGLDASLIKNVSYSVDGKTHTLMFTVPAENAAAVFGEAFGITSEASVVLTGNGAEVTGISVTYTSDIVSEDEDVIYPAASVTLNTTYSYVLEQVTLVK